MTDTTTAPPVSPSEGTPNKPAAEQTDEYLATLEENTKAEMQAKMAAQVPPVLQKEFLAKYPPGKQKTYGPLDDEDRRQADAKRGEKAPNEPEYEVVPNPRAHQPAEAGGSAQAPADAATTPPTDPNAPPG
jgi:hypothetical protein